MLYPVLDAVRNLEEAAYNKRLLSTFAAANGLLMFGWSTALVFAAVQWIY